SEEPLPSKRKRKVSPLALQVTRVTPGFSVFVLTHVPEKSERAPGAAAPIFSAWSCTRKYFINDFSFRSCLCEAPIVASSHVLCCTFLGVFNPCRWLMKAFRFDPGVIT